ncbi:hypothetical protein ElyMa_001879300 [Elysia marginata]|uniref:Uncharacterized protein n=1 Tax=Elysia marginata TaxID=1093978 RepID=A0AAV4EPW8_9GAST|nr:hypothetical protein ElyMa_001879300 [Elysia marginata]
MSPPVTNPVSIVSSSSSSVSTFYHQHHPPQHCTIIIRLIHHRISQLYPYHLSQDYTVIYHLNMVPSSPISSLQHQNTVPSSTNSIINGDLSPAYEVHSSRYCMNLFLMPP